jgi:O-antigen/teichoic acid export membrane protein
MTAPRSAPPIALSVVSNWIGMLVVALVSFLLVPILIRGLGSFDYGIWILLSAIVDYYGLLDLGMRTTVQRFVAQLRSTNDRAALNQLAATAWLLAIATSILIALISVAVTPFLPDLFHLAGETRQTSRLTLLLLGLAVAVTVPSQLLASYLYGCQRFDLYNMTFASAAIVRAGALALILHLGHGLRGVAAVTLVMSLVTCIVHWRLVRWVDPDLSIRPGLASHHCLREILSFGAYVTLNGAGDQLRFRMDSVVIARWVNVASIALFNVAGVLMEYFKRAVSAASAPLMSRMAALEADRKTAELRDLFLRSTRFTSIMSFSLAGLLLLNGRAVLKLWVGEEFVPSFDLVVILVIPYAVALAQLPSVSAIYACGRHRPMAVWTALEGVLNLALSIYLGQRLGLLGVALGTAVPMLFVKLFVQPWFTLRLLRVSSTVYLRESIGRPLLITTVWLGLCFVLRPVDPSDGLTSFAWSVAWQSALLVGLAYVGVLTRGERTALRMNRHFLIASLRTSRG